MPLPVCARDIREEVIDGEAVPGVYWVSSAGTSSGKVLTKEAIAEIAEALLWFWTLGGARLDRPMSGNRSDIFSRTGLPC
mmetsp:Transcript_109123/g.319396  ORF Transcript_109123/g.319396 Transcript_109123/m.319396 type:complete len:80 (-) Transcript_109123:1175-1414(-)